MDDGFYDYLDHLHLWFVNLDNFGPVEEGASQFFPFFFPPEPWVRDSTGDPVMNAATWICYFQQVTIGDAAVTEQ